MKEALVAIAILVLAAPGVYADREFTYDKQDNFDGAAVKSLQIDIPSGEILLVKSSGSDIEVRYKNTVMAEDQDDADDINKDMDYRAELSGDKLVISVESPRHKKHSKGIINRIIEGNWSDDIYPAVKISLPDGKIVDISSASADIEVDGLKLDLDIRSASSDINLDDTKGSFSCKVASGDIDMTNHEGDASIKGVSSDLRLSDIDGDLDLITTSGDITVESASGSAHVNSISGDVRLLALSAVEGNFDIKTVSGEVGVEVSPKFKGDLMVNSVSGSVRSHLAGKTVIEDDEHDRRSHSRMRGTVGDDGKGRLSVVTTSGDIDISGY